MVVDRIAWPKNRESLAPRMAPAAISFVPALAISANGKIDRTLARQRSCKVTGSYTP